ncbi:MAG: hypothetical protein E6X68_10310 [Staphylococcus haemolyticus]|nr:hypothetical protein EfmE1039_0091 [Enterococcus faecium E1039]EPI23573.1 hypothetical protein D353_00490 [Enterococcus faecium OC2A-1]MDU4859243.1 hypothetical protein [Staphylococcus haemolyticus]
MTYWYSESAVTFKTMEKVEIKMKKKQTRLSLAFKKTELLE